MNNTIEIIARKPEQAEKAWRKINKTLTRRFNTYGLRRINSGCYGENFRIVAELPELVWFWEQRQVSIYDLRSWVDDGVLVRG